MQRHESLNHQQRRGMKGPICSCQNFSAQPLASDKGNHSKLPHTSPVQSMQRHDRLHLQTHRLNAGRSPIRDNRCQSCAQILSNHQQCRGMKGSIRNPQVSAQHSHCPMRSKVSSPTPQTQRHDRLHFRLSSAG